MSIDREKSRRSRSGGRKEIVECGREGWISGKSHGRSREEKVGKMRSGRARRRRMSRRGRRSGAICSGRGNK